MDIAPHILDAVQTSAVPDQSSFLDSDSTKSPTFPTRSSFLGHNHDALSSAEDLSTTSDSGNDHGYQTDFTTPESSDSCAEDMQPDDVEDFRDREYPQLKGKTYLDHGGTTVRCPASLDRL